MKHWEKVLFAIALVLLIAGATIASASLALGVKFSQIPQALSFNIGGVQLGSFAPHNFSNEFSADGQYSVPAAQIDAIEVNWISGNVEVVIVEDENIRFAEQANTTIDAENALRYGMEDSRLIIDYCQDALIDCPEEKQLKIEIPKALADGMKEFCFDGTSAGLLLPDLKATQLDLESTSGELNVQSVSADRVKLDSSSGEIRFSGSYTRLDAENTSGSIFIESLGNPEVTRLNTVSGEISLAGALGKLKAESTSGGLLSERGVDADEFDFSTTSGAANVLLNRCPRELDIETISGDVRLTLPKDAGFTLEFDSTSGEFSSDLSLVQKKNHYICGDGRAEFEIETTSGDLSLN